MGNPAGMAARGPGVAESPDSPRVWLIADGARVMAARPEDMPIVAAILDEASVWLESRGLECWPRPFPAATLEGDLARGASYVAWDGDVAAGTFSLYRTDPAFWGERPEDLPGYALYLHKLATRRGRPGLGRAMVELAESMARDEGAACIRLDCVAANAAIRDYYERAGYECRGVVDVAFLNWPAALYEKALQ